MDRGSAPWRSLEEPEGHEHLRAVSGPGVPDGRTGPVGATSQPADGPVRPRQWAIAGAGIVAAVVLAGIALATTTGRPTELTLAGVETGATPAVEVDPANAGERTSITVDVGGAVKRPGVYRLAAGSRVADAIAAAGGYSAGVDVASASDRLNLAAVLADGERVRIPARGEPGLTATGAPPTGDPSSSGPNSPAGPVDLNRATAAELEALPGIGPVTAAKIIAAREQEPYASVDDLRTRGLVGPATFAKIQALVAVDR